MQRAENSQGNLKEEKLGGFTLPHIKKHFKATEISIGWHWGKQRQTDQRTEYKSSHTQVVA